MSDTRVASDKIKQNLASSMSLLDEVEYDMVRHSDALEREELLKIKEWLEMKLNWVDELIDDYQDR